MTMEKETQQQKRDAYGDLIMARSGLKNARAYMELAMGQSVFSGLERQKMAEIQLGIGKLLDDMQFLIALMTARLN